MKFLSLFVLTLIQFLHSSSSLDESEEWVKLFNLPKRDNKVLATVCQLDSQTVNDFVVKHQNNGLVLIGKSTSTDFAQKSAQLLSNRNITVCQLSALDPTVADDSVIIHINGKQYQYNGRRSPSALLSYILKLKTSHIKLITGKLDKMAYDLVTGPKMVGFFMPSVPTLPDQVAYETVAQKYSPDIPFYLVNDRVVAKHLKLTIVGQINLVKRLEKLSIPCPVNPATAQDIEAFIKQNKGVVLKYLTEHNIYDPNLQNPNKTTLIAIGDRTTAVGQYFHKVLTRTVKNITRENSNVINAQIISSESTTTNETSETPAPVGIVVDLNAIEILWIDPKIFPSIDVLLDEIQSHYGLVAGLDAYLGAINTKSNQTVWFDTNLVNTTGDKLADESNLQLLKDFITNVINNQTVLISTDTTVDSSVQDFIKEPQSMTVSENQELVLECEVRGQVGDCLWLKDGQNIGFNLARISTDYSWRQNDGLGDCSLVIARAQADRDSGEWVCEVTGDQTNPTITSSPAIVSVKSVTKNEL